MSRNYAECPFDKAPTDESVRSLIEASVRDENWLDLRYNLLCIFRACCLEHLGKMTVGSPSALLTAIIDSARDNNANSPIPDFDSCEEQLKAVIDKVTGFEREERLFIRFCEEDVIPEENLFQLFKAIQRNLLFLREYSGDESVQVLVDRTEYEISRPKAIRAELRKNTLNGFFNAVRLAFQVICHEKIGDRNFVGGFWLGYANPKIENQCSDHLRSYFDALFYLDEIEVVREHPFPGGNCDLCFKFGDWILPVEAKRSMHRDLWRAANDQLIKQYIETNIDNPYGIYLVYWFGEEGAAGKPHRSRFDAPSTPKELQESLYKYRVPTEYQPYVDVCCIDCLAK